MSSIISFFVNGSNAMGVSLIEFLFPFIIVSLDLAAAVVYVCMRKYTQGIYWGFAAGLTICVIVMSMSKIKG